MSLCRWSSMDWQCDLYVYEGEHGWAVHVAGNRVDAEVPKIDLTTTESFARTHAAQSAVLDNAPRVPIGGPHDSASFYDLDNEEVIDTLTMLQAEGYRFPPDMIAMLQAEFQGG